MVIFTGGAPPADGVIGPPISFPLRKAEKKSMGLESDTVVPPSPYIPVCLNTSMTMDFAARNLKASQNILSRPPHSNWVVQKFGGTSVGKFALNIIEQVVEYVMLSPPLSLSLPLLLCGISAVMISIAYYSLHPDPAW